MTLPVQLCVPLLVASTVRGSQQAYMAATSLAAARAGCQRT
jgi:hypothetical protein